ncbi:uncharacterized protein TNCV_2882191 [Trichonephila clavipes]|nr:uncharacterized protein TNCV_2882191 [Trichonephila clavipes]
MPKQNQARKTETDVYTSPFYKSVPALRVQQSLNSFSIPIPNSHALNSKNTPILLFSFLSLIGLAQQFDKTQLLRKIWILFYFLLLFQILDMMVLCIMSSLDGYSFKHSAAYVFSLFCNLVIWHSLRRKKKNLMNLLRMMDKVCPANYNKRTNITMLILLSFPFMYSVSNVLLRDRKVTMLYTYGQELQSLTLQVCVIFIKIFLQFLFHSTFPSIIAVSFCYLCLRCSFCLNRLTQKVLQYSPEEFGPTEQIEILRQKSKIDDILEHLQDIFSAPSFFVIISNIFICSSILGMTLTGIHYKILLVTVVLYGISNLISLIGVLWTAGGLPSEQNKLKDAFYKRAHSRFLIAMTSEETMCKREILDKPNFVLNGCSIFYYTRNSIFTLTGMLLTYAFVIYPN